ncbi:MAG: dicarboxylate/amino acid:cation symporter [Acidobacteria bacterium]|nr:dicarboxylate/amino acid:cation symporter [Acidobacteriota bacterium]
MKGKKLALHWQILIALGLAVIAGRLTGTEGTALGVRWFAVYGFVGTLFLNALKMLIVPLIASSIIVGVSGIGGEESLGRLGLRTLAYYIVTSLLAILTGLALVNLVRPGIIHGQPARTVIGLTGSVQEVAAHVHGRGMADVVGIFLRMVPTNVVQAASDNRAMLAVIFFSLLFGFYMARIPEPGRGVLHGFWQGVLDVMMRITDLVMRFAPIGVFGLVAKVMASTGFAAFIPLASFFAVVLAGLTIHMFVTLPLILRLVAGVKRPWRQHRAMGPALLMAFSTSSSAATLPVTLECVQKRAGVSERVASFVLPLGATVNMDGTALYECVAAMFIAQAYGLHMSFGTQFNVVLMALLTSIGVAGVPSASLVAIAIILSAVGLPLEAIGLILVVDRLLDMARTAVNVFSDTCGAVTVARLEGERGILEGELG